MMCIGIRHWALVAAATASLVGGAPLGAQVPPAIEVTPSVDHVTIGDRINLQFAVEHAVGGLVLWPDSLPIVSPFEQLAAPMVSETTPNTETTTSNASYVVAAFELGELTFPEITFEFVQTTGDTIHITSPVVPIVVATVGLEWSDDIRGIKPPLSIPLSWVVVALWLAGGFLVGAGAYFLYRRFKRQDRSFTPPRVATPPKPPHVVAYEALDRLERSSLLEQDQIQQWYTEVSEVIRVYIGGRYGVHAMEMATSDILVALEPFRLDYRSLDQFRDFFERADLVKFAKHRPSQPACRALLESARKLVDLTREPDTASTADVQPPNTATAA